jgi:hypothetical protein
VRRAARADVSQREIAGAFRVQGCSVVHTHGVGQGVPDLAVGLMNRTHFVEAKRPVTDANWRPGSDFTADQIEFQATWRGCYHTARTAEDAGELVKAWRAGREEPERRTP